MCSMYESSREIEVGEFLPDDLQWAMKLSLTAQDRVSAVTDSCSLGLISMILNGSRKVTNNTKSIIERLLLLSRKRTLELMAHSQKAFNILNQFDIQEDEEPIQLARDGRY